jgi:hypothetical protein
VELVVLAAVPLLMRHGRVWENDLARDGADRGRLMVQLASLAFWLPLEIYQTRFGHPMSGIARVAGSSCLRF